MTAGCIYNKFCIDRSTAGIDYAHALFHQVEFPGTQQVMGFLGQGCVQRHKIGLTQQVIERAIFGIVDHLAAVVNDVHAESTAALGDRDPGTSRHRRSTPTHTVSSGAGGSKA